MSKKIKEEEREHRKDLPWKRKHCNPERPVFRFLWCSSSHLECAVCHLIKRHTLRVGGLHCFPSSLVNAGDYTVRTVEVCSKIVVRQ